MKLNALASITYEKIVDRVRPPSAIYVGMLDANCRSLLDHKSVT